MLLKWENSVIFGTAFHWPVVSVFGVYEDFPAHSLEEDIG